jgi:stearoyl-CoA desaturase (delta-9 desaturase)
LVAIDPGSVRWKKDNVYGFLAVHLIAALAAFPWFFSWTGVGLLLAGLFVFGVLGINLCFHRLLTHRGLVCPLWLERSFAFLGACCMQDSPPHWVAVHRKHHHYSDEPSDPHSPLVSFFWAHMGWLLVRREDMKRGALIERYAKDIMRDPFYAWLERRHNWLKVVLVSWIAFFVAGYAFVAISGGTASEAAQFGLSLFVWGAVLRTVVVWHITWSINSVTHVWGYRNYETPDVSRNNPFIALLSSGEGWHNNHHADPRSARHGHSRWEIDVTWMIIRALTMLGLAKEVAWPSPILAEKFPHAPRLAPDTTTPPAAHALASLAPDSEPGGGARQSGAKADWAQR